MQEELLGSILQEILQGLGSSPVEQAMAAVIGGVLGDWHSGQGDVSWGNLHSELLSLEEWIHHLREQTQRFEYQ